MPKRFGTFISIHLLDTYTFAVSKISLTLGNVLQAASWSAPLSPLKIVFSPPDEKFGQVLDQATVNLFLYDIRESLELRNNEPVIERKNGQVTTKRRLRVACSYLVTAWSEKTGDTGLLLEQKLLGQVL